VSEPRASFLDAFHVAWFELVDALRSRKALALLGLYTAASGAAASIFLRVLEEIEKNAAELLHVAPTTPTGTMTSVLLQSEAFREMLGRLVGDPKLVDSLAAIPPMALFYGWLTLGVVPALVMLTSTDAIAGELQSGEARYALVRIDRLSWSVGKLFGQALLMGLGVALGGVAVWIVGALGWAGFEKIQSAVWILRLGARAWIYGFAWLGLALAVSQVTASAALARGLGVCALLVIGILGSILEWPRIHREAPILFDSLRMLFPGAHAIGLWQPIWTDRAPSVVLLLALGCVYFALGHRRLATRDV
jgi:ABC-type transport system involved in multi-copper enzyme maturation permease subunit